MKPRNNLIGQKFNMLSVIDYDDKIKKWVCECDCGNIVSIRTSQLNNGHTKSCGCLQRKSVLELNERKKVINNISILDSYIIVFAQNTNQEILLDKEDYDLVKNYCWRIDNHGYVVTSTYNPNTKRNNKIIRLHRLIMNPDDKMVVDHINGNKLDNRKNNLRICTQSDNTKNHSIPKNSTTGVTGVRWNKKNKNWRVVISGKNIGSFKNFEDAVKARLDAENKYFGEYSRNNSMNIIFDAI